VRRGCVWWQYARWCVVKVLAQQKSGCVKPLVKAVCVIAPCNCSLHWLLVAAFDVSG
jgi:hypothetical protein